MANYNIYCDESCHLENDQQRVMVLGAIWCPSSITKQSFLEIRDIKRTYGIKPNVEIKWNKVSPAQLSFYSALIRYFFDNNDLHFRALVIPDKTMLRHEVFRQTHDTWYYKMYFDMLKAILSPNDSYRIYLDIKDTKSADKVTKLRDVLCNNFYDFDRQIIQNLQIVQSHEVELVQLADLLIGAVSYANRNLETSIAKLKLVELMRQLSGYSLTKTNLLRETKVNIFIWRATEQQD